MERKALERRTVLMDLMSRLLSPYDLNPLAYNPRKILVQCIDFERLARSPIKLFVTATSVRTGRGRIFRNADITADVLLASACLPTMFRAIEIGSRAFSDFLTVQPEEFVRRLPSFLLEQVKEGTLGIELRGSTELGKFIRNDAMG